MRIALLRPLPDAGRASMEVYGNELASAMNSLMKPSDSVDFFPGKKELDSWNVSLRSPCGKWKRYWQQYVAYGRTARKVPADLYHVLDHGYGNTVPFFRQRKTVVTFHDALLPNLEKGTIPVKTRPFTAIAAQRYALNCMKKATHIISVSNFSRSELLKHASISPESVTVVHEGVNARFFQEISDHDKRSFRKKWNLPEDTALVLMTGRTDPHKNIEGGLKAFAEFKKRYSMRSALLKTGNPFTEEQRSLIRQFKLEDSVFDLGGMPYADIPAAYHCSAALLFLSFYEGFGFPVLEAMASGIPTVISHCGSLPEIGGDAALFVDPQNSTAAAESLYKAIAEPAFRQQVIEKGKRRAAAFTWEKSARETLQVYRKVLS